MHAMSECKTYSVTQVDYPNGRLMCTSSCVMYSYFCHKQKDIYQTKSCFCVCIPTENTMKKIFQMASILHIDTLKHCKCKGNSMLSVHDILCASTQNEMNHSLFGMKEIMGSFNEETLKLFKNEISASTVAIAEHENSLLESGEDILIYSFEEALNSFLMEGVSAILTIEDCQHTVSIHKCNGGSCTLFDPLSGSITKFPSTAAITAHIIEKQFREQFTCYFL